MWFVIGVLIWCLLISPSVFFVLWIFLWMGIWKRMEVVRARHELGRWLAFHGGVR